MRYPIEILKESLDKLNSAYSELVTNGTIDSKSVIARNNREKAESLEEALIVLDGEFIFESTPLGKILIVSKLNNDAIIKNYIESKSIDSGVSVDDIFLNIEEGEVKAFESQSPGGGIYLEEIK